MRIRRVIGMAAAVLAAGTAALTGPTSALAAGSASNDGLVAWYPLKETSGTAAANAASGSAFGAAAVAGGGVRTAQGVQLDGVDDYVDLPHNLLAGLTDLTVSVDVLVDAAQATPYFIYGLGNTSGTSGNGYLFTTGDAYRSSITTGNYRTEQTVTKGSALTRGVWKTLTYSLSGTTATLYEDGAQVGQNTGVTIDPQEIGAGVTTANYIGRSLYSGDKYLKGQVRDFRLYNRALSSAEVADLASATATAAAEADANALDLGDTTSVAGDLALPAKGAQGSAITWASSDPAAVTAAGKVTRPPYGAEPATATLTATVTRGVVTRTRTFPVTVLPELSDAQTVAYALDHVTVKDIGDVRGNLNLPASLAGVTLTWTSSNPDIITGTGEVSRPAAGKAAATVTLTVKGEKGGASATRDIAATVPALPKAEKPFGYLLAHFVEDANGYKEKVYFSLSRGEDPTRWYRLNNGEAALTSNLGTTGIRDPYLVRSPEGDKFYIVATDLRIFGGDNAGWGVWGSKGSRSLVVWESTDLVHWSEPRLAEVAPPSAGMAWAPEVVYDEDKGDYVVFWASNLFDQATDPNHTGSTYSRILYARTRDFTEFTPAKVLLDTGSATIDTTMIKAGGKIYRFHKDNGPTNLKVYGDVGSGILADDFTMIKSHIGEAQYGGSVEGPLVFKDSYADKWYLWVDRYGSVQGYAPLVSTDIAKGDWAAPSGTFELPANTKHGAVIALRGGEWERLAGLHTTSVEGVAAQTDVGVSPALPDAVTVHLSDESTQQRKVTWNAIDPEDLATAGTFTVKGDVIGTDVAATATITVIGSSPSVPLTVTASSRCVGSSAYVAVTAVNAADVPASVTLSTPYGSKTVADVAPGKQAYQSFNARTGQLAAGAVKVTGTARIGGKHVTSSFDATYSAIGCG
ncbi:immunoglobulin-like domain-containing protein [Microbispora sp. CA-102843]|uniref:immunoglobulin-like domain-containing protein n=1 Tax=Microbispora sp. CA-102843 TaxID=3239952 RepID=UPI003D89EA38